MNSINSLSELYYKMSGVYSWLRKNKPNLLYKVLPTNRWSLELCKKEALKYKTRSEWKTSNNRSYDAARSNGWIKECTEHMNTILHKFSKKEILLSARKYKNRSEWKKATYPGIIKYASTRGWLKEATQHMTNRLDGKYVKNLDTNDIYCSATEASKLLKINKGNLCCSARNRKYRAGGYRWAYCDENGKIIKNGSKK